MIIVDEEPHAHVEQLLDELIEFHNFMVVNDPMQERTRQTKLYFYSAQSYPPGTLRRASIKQVDASRDATVWYVGDTTVDNGLYRLCIEPDGEIYFTIMIDGPTQAFHIESFIVNRRYLETLEDWQLDLIQKLVEEKRADFAREARSRQVINDSRRVIEESRQQLDRLAGRPFDRERWEAVRHLFPDHD